MKKILIILGGGINPEDESLNSVTKARCNEALLIAGRYDSIILSSWKTYKKEIAEKIKGSEAQSMANYLLSQGIRPDKLILEQKSRDTLSNAYYCRLILERIPGEIEVDVLTSSFHMPKARFVFGTVFFGTRFKLKFIEAPNGMDEEQTLRRKAYEQMVLEFYLKHLFTDYGVVKGDMDSIRKFVEEKNYATSGNQDPYQQALSERVEMLLGIDPLEKEA